MKMLWPNMTAAEAEERWFEHWLRSTDPEGSEGDRREVPMYRERFERLCEQEATGIPAQPVEVPEFDSAAERAGAQSFKSRHREGGHRMDGLKMKTRLDRFALGQRQEM